MNIKAIQWRECFSNMKLKTLVDSETSKYAICHSVSYSGPSLTRRVEWYATFHGRRICNDTTKPKAKQAAEQHRNEGKWIK